jgi:hypothetical protein
MKLKTLIFAWLAKKLPTCKEITRMASDAMERRLSLRQRLDFKLHLMICSLCLRYVQQLHMLREAAHQHTTKVETGVAAPSARLSQDARKRMKQSLHT